MKRCLLAMLATLGTGVARADTAAEVMAADSARTAALIAADRAALDASLAKELRYVHSNGLVQDRATYLDAAVGGAMTYTTITPVQRQVRELSPQVALLTGNNHVAVVLNGKPLQADVLYTAVYVHEGAGWKLTAWQSTPAPKPESGQ
jgi:hypothetical protein